MPSSQLNLLSAQDIFKEEKPGIRYYRILKSLPDISKHVSNKPYLDEMDAIHGGLYDLQAKAITLESQGKTQMAMRLYWQLVNANFDDPHAFLRLVEFHKTRKNQKEITIVCQSFLKMTEILNALGYEQPYRNSIAELFRDILQKTG